MPRKRKVAEDASTPPPKRKAGARTSEAEMLTRRRIIRGLMLVSSTPDQCLVAMRSKWPDITMAEVKRLYVEAELELRERQLDSIETKKRKQEARLLSHIASATGDKAHSAVASLEGKYAEVAGTLAPVKVEHTMSFTERFQQAFQKHAALLTEEQAQGLLNGRTVPLGGGAAIEAIDTTGESKES